MITVITALKQEHDALLARAPHLNAVVCGKGKVAAALCTAEQISRSHPALVVMAGIAGGLVPNVNVGDVVVATHTIEHDFNSVWKQSPPTYAADASALSQLKSFNTNGFAVHFAPIASGDCDITHRQMADEVHHKTGAWAVAWEGAGAARASHRAKTPFVEIRAIVDLANASTTVDAHKNFIVAMDHLAQILSAFHTSRPKA